MNSKKLAGFALWGVLLITQASTEGRLPEASLEVGMSEARVQEHFGLPHGTISMGEREALIYPRGRVMVVDGAVVDWRFRSPEDLSALEARREAATRLNRQAALRELARLRQSEVPLDVRLQRLQSIDARYPELGAGAPLAAARAEVRAREAQAAEAARLAALEARVAEAEQRAKAALNVARRADRDGYRYFRRGYRGFGVPVSPFGGSRHFDPQGRDFSTPVFDVRDRAPTGRTGPIEDVTPEIRPGFSAGQTTNARSFSIKRVN